MPNVLFLCTGNSARSIMAEYYAAHIGKGTWVSFSAGSKPTGKPNPFALETLARHDIDVNTSAEPPRSKSWDEFAANDAPIMDFVVTVCDNAANETCPVWPQKPGESPVKLHWGFPDPAAASGSDDEIRDAFEAVFADIRTQIDALIAGTV